MKFTIFAPLLTAVLALTSAHLATSEEDTVGNWTISKYPIKNVLQEMSLPSIASDTIVPPHLQYIIGLDQSGLIDSWNSLPVSDPEYGIALSSGVFTPDGDKLKQVINRCRGGGWIFFDYDSKKLDWHNSLTFTGRDFFENINDDDERCELTFTWDKARTKAIITGYWAPSASFMDQVMTLDISLQPYWQWKFGLKTKGNYKNLDEKCCPPTKDKSCSGAGTLGVEGTPCETISMACGEIAEKNASKCAMFKRSNYSLGGLLPLFGYLAYPLADRYGEATSYNSHYLSAVRSRGVDTLFHGIIETEQLQQQNESVEATEATEEDENAEL
jgi:hypothetical protein